MAKTKKQVKQEETVINLDSFAVPIAIVVAGIVIALAVFLSNKGANQKENVSKEKETITAGSDEQEAPSSSSSSMLGNAPYVGDKSKAKIAIIEYSDFQCGYCKRHADEVYPELKSKFVDTGEIIYVFKSYPLGESGLGYNAAVASQCVAGLVDGDKFASFHTKMFSVTSDADIKAAAVELGVDAGKYDACITSEDAKQKVMADRTEGSKAGVEGTPGFVVGKIGDDGKVDGVIIKGAYPFSEFESAITKLSQ